MVDHAIPTTLEEALDTMKKGTYRPIAGGTDIMVKRRSWANTPPEFDFDALYLFKLDELRGIEVEADQISVGALTPYETLLEHEAIPEPLKACIRELASPALRHVATLAGNIANASPAADAVLVLIMLDAKARIRSADGERTVLVKDLITGPSRTELKPDELITTILIPLPTFTHTYFKKVGGRKADAISKIAFSGAARIEEGVVKDLRIALNAVAATVVRAPEIENAYIGKRPHDLKAHEDAIIKAYDEHIRPIDDQRSNKTYRRHVAHNLIRRFLDIL
ncbi:MAG: FAD binding domain-containing protein [Bacillota bacterium]